MGIGGSRPFPMGRPACARTGLDRHEDEQIERKRYERLDREHILPSGRAGKIVGRTTATKAPKNAENEHPQDHRALSLIAPDTGDFVKISGLSRNGNFHRRFGNGEIPTERNTGHQSHKKSE